MRTLVVLVREPGRAFSAPGRLGPALLFFGVSLVLRLITAVVPWGAMVASWPEAFVAPGDLAWGLGFALAPPVLVPIVGVLAAASIYRVSARLAKAPVAWGPAIRTAAYSSGIASYLGLTALLAIPAAGDPTAEGVVWVLLRVVGIVVVPALQLRLWWASATHDASDRGSRQIAFAGPGAAIGLLAVLDVGFAVWSRLV